MPAPYPLAMVVCDAVWCDPGTGKAFLLGCFSGITAVEFPVVHPLLAVYAALTDGRGTVNVNLKLVDSDEENDPLFDGQMPVQFDDPRMISELAFHLPGITFPKAGEYRFNCSPTVSSC